MNARSFKFLKSGNSCICLDLILQNKKGTAIVLVLPRSQPATVFRTYRFALCGVGNPTRFASTFASLTCVLAVFVVTWHGR